MKLREPLGSSREEETRSRTQLINRLDSFQRVKPSQTNFNMFLKLRRKRSRSIARFFRPGSLNPERMEGWKEQSSKGNEWLFNPGAVAFSRVW